MTVRPPASERGGPGAPGIRKPRPQRWRLRTDPPFRVAKVGCYGGGPGPCPAAGGLSVELSDESVSARDGATDDEAEDAPPRAQPPMPVRVTPEVPGLQVERWSRSFSVRGPFAAHTTYTVTLDASLRDRNGRAIEGRRVFRVRTRGGDRTLLVPRRMVVLDPSHGGQLPIYSMNVPSLEVELRAVRPEDYLAFRAHRKARWNSGKENAPVPPLPGRVVSKKTVATKDRDQLVRTLVDLTDGLDDGVGQLIVRVRGLPPFTARACGCRRGPTRPTSEEATLWVQVTRLGLDAVSDGERIVASVRSLGGGQPLAGVDVRLAGEAPVATDAAGLASLPLADAPRALLVAESGADVAFLAAEDSPDWRMDESRRGIVTGRWWSGWEWREDEEEAGAVEEVEVGSRVEPFTWRRRTPAVRLAWHIFDPRSLYRPGDDVRLKGWLRRATGGARGDLEPLGDSVRQVRYRLVDPQGAELARGETSVNRFGAFDLSFGIPAQVNVGDVSVELEALPAGLAGSRHATSLTIAEYRRPEFAVSVSADAKEVTLGGRVAVSASADYLSGGPLARTGVRWEVASSSSEFAPPGHRGFQFGREPAPGTWWCGSVQSQTREHVSKTDGSGRARVALELDGVDPAQPFQLDVAAVVADASRQESRGSASVLVHPGDVYVGLRRRADASRLGFDLIATDRAGNAAAGHEITLRAERVDWGGLASRDRCEREPEVRATHECRVSSGPLEVSCDLGTPEPGSYRVTARVVDTAGRAHEARVWTKVVAPVVDAAPVSNDQESEPASRCWRRQGCPAAAKLEVEGDGHTDREYAPGEIAVVGLQLPFAPADVLLTLRRSGIVRVERFRMEEPARSLRIPLEDAFAPSVQVHVRATGVGPARLRLSRDGAATVATAEGELELRVQPDARRLVVTVSPRSARVRPGDVTSVAVGVADAAGRPLAGSEVAVAVVDDSVLTLGGYHLADPLRSLAIARAPGVASHGMPLLPAALGAPLSEEHLIRDLDYAQAWSGGVYDSLDLGIAGGVVGGVAGGRAARAEYLFLDQAEELRRQAGSGRLRSDYRTLALFVASAVTDEKGRVGVTLNVPDSLTRYRVLAVATDGGRRFGTGEATFAADLALLVRPSPPRFLRTGDRFELPVIVQNRTDAPLDVALGVRAAGLQIGEAGRRLRVGPRDRVPVRFAAVAGSPGEARLQVVARSGAMADAAELRVPVQVVVAREAVAAYGTIDGDGNGVVAQPFVAPVDTLPGYGGLSITTSTTALSELADAVAYLVSYRYECSEQIASRLMTLAVLKDALAAFASDRLPPLAELQERMQQDADALVLRQDEKGAIGLWRRGDRSGPFVSVHVAHALVLAAAHGVAVAPLVLERSARYLGDDRAVLADVREADARRVLEAYALYVRSVAGHPDRRRARRIAREALRGELPPDAAGFLLGALAGDPGSTAERALLRREIRNRLAEESTTAHVATSYRDDEQVVLRSDRRTDAIVLLALLADGEAPALTAKLARGLLAHRRAGRWRSTQENAFALLALDRYFDAQEAAPPEFRLRAWAGARFLGAESWAGRTTERRSWHLPFGDALAAGRQDDVVLEKEGPGRLYYRIGMESASTGSASPVTRGFAVERRYVIAGGDEPLPRDADGVWRAPTGSSVEVRLKLHVPSWRHHVALVDPLPAGLELPYRASVACGPAFEHTSPRDDRVEAFASSLPGGVYECRYTARATTAGAFAVAPATAEEMYAPETFGRTASERFVVGVEAK